MKHKNYYEDYNEVMFDERDAIKDYLDKAKILGCTNADGSFDLKPAVELNGIRVHKLIPDNDVFVRFSISTFVATAREYTCCDFDYGDLSKILDALPELDELIPDIMDTHNSHDAELVRKINAAWKSEKYHLMFGDILYAIGCRDNQEIYDKYDVIIDCNEAAMDCAHEIMEGVCDDLDLETILSFIRYEED